MSILAVLLPRTHEGTTFLGGAGAPSSMPASLRIAAVLAATAVAACSSPARSSPARSAPAAAGPPVQLGSSTSPMALAVDSTRVYWVDDVEGTVVSARLDGSGQTTLASGQQAPSLIAVDEGDVYWVDDADPTVTLMHLSTRGAPASLWSAAGYATALALDAGHAYVAMARTTAGGAGPNGVVVAIPRAGGPAATIAAGQAYPTALAIAGATAFWANAGTPPASPGSGDYTDGSVVAAPLAGGAPSPLATGIVGLAAMALGTTLFVSSQQGASGSLMACPVAGCGQTNANAVSIPVAASAPGQGGMVADGDTVYFVTYGSGSGTAQDGAIRKASTAQPTAVDVVTGRRHPCRITLDATSVYWIEGCVEGQDIPAGSVWKAGR